MLIRFSLRNKWLEKHKRRSEFAGLMTLEKAYGRVNREALWQVLKMYDVAGKLLKGMKCMYLCVEVNKVTVTHLK